MTHIYIKPSSNQRSTTSREASAAGRLRPNAVTAEVGTGPNFSDFPTYRTDAIGQHIAKRITATSRTPLWPV